MRGAAISTRGAHRELGRIVRRGLRPDAPRRLLTIIRERLRRAVLGADFEQRIEALETGLHESREETWDRSRTRWRSTQPDTNLTWGVGLSGEPFISKMAEHGALGPDRRLMEVGPGYGRLLSAALEHGAGFESYVGVDLSADNVAHLRERFSQEDITFLNADIESVGVGEPVDSVMSSLTFKHLFPSFENALRNIAAQMRAGGLLVFDLVEGHRRYFEADAVTYIRYYTRPEVESILRATGLELVTFDEVWHRPEAVRLLVVARKTP